MTCTANLVQELHANDIGTEIRISLLDAGEPVDLTGATVEILLRGEDGLTKTKPAEIVGLPAAGIVRCYTAAGDLVVGNLAIQVKVTSPSWTGHSKKIAAVVYPTLS
jgi:hypothetical protein